MSDATHDTMPVKNREWVAGRLEKVPVVEWDRFTVGQINDNQVLDVYGWIERDDDAYKDFVWTRLWTELKELEFTTSSDRYSEYLHVEWFVEDSLDEHNECRRVEHAFDVENAIELGEQSTLGEVQ